jgi:hypothetical protein
MGMKHKYESLDELGRRFRTDKSSIHHDYLTFYERFFEKFRDQQVKILEVGIHRGFSLEVWREYFQRGTIIGADIKPLVPAPPSSRITIEVIDQSNIEDLVQLGIRHGPFDIIIEDGSHLWEHQITTFRTLFPFVRDGGIYIAEDLQTNFGPMESDYRGVSSISCVDYLKKLVDLRVADDQIDIDKVEDAFLRTYGRGAHFIAFYRRACLVEKSASRKAKDSEVYQPFLPVVHQDRLVQLSLLAHIGNVGDRLSDAGWIRCIEDSQNIQGVLLDRQNGSKSDINYRVRSANETWTDWVGLGEFLGTRGVGQDLTGFSVRLSDALREEFEIRAVGVFRGQSDVVTISSGEDCVPESENGWLFGMQVTLLSKKPSR